MRGAGSARHDRAARRKAQSIARGRLHAVQPRRRSACDPDGERLQGYPLHDREVGRAWVKPSPYHSGTRASVDPESRDSGFASRPGMTPAALPDPPADLLRKTAVKFIIIGARRPLAHTLVEAVRIVADQDAPALSLDAVEDDLCGLSRRRRRLVAKTAGAIGRDFLDVLVRHWLRVDADAF